MLLCYIVSSFYSYPTSSKNFAHSSADFVESSFNFKTVVSLFGKMFGGTIFHFVKTMSYKRESTTTDGRYYI